MKSLNFTKMHGLGNDFIVVDATQSPFDLNHETIAALGNRYTGIGFDQALIVEPASQPDVDFNYRIFNTDGSEVEHCGNGARCFARYVIKNGLTDKTQLRVKVKKGIIDIVYRDDDNIEVDMGEAILAPMDVPFAVNGKQLSADDAYQTQYNLDFHGEKIPVSVLSVGNPHAVFAVSNVWELKIAELGQMVQLSGYFPESVNVNFVEMHDDKTLSLRTFERGVGETNACGTGACASAFALNQLGVTQSEVTVTMRGGQLKVRIDGQRIYMSGPARESYTGVVKLPLQ